MVPEIKRGPVRSRFALGRILATPGALEILTLDQVRTCLVRHVSGDWGDLSEQDKAENELSVAQNFRILSAYNLPDGEKIWVITEADRSATTLLLPEEY